MIVIGLTGGIGSGKSTVAAYLESLGARVINADQVGHAIMEPGTKGYQRIVAAFGREILREDTAAASSIAAADSAAADAADSVETAAAPIDRAKLGALVFADRQKLTLLNSLTHPLIREKITAAIAELRAADNSATLASDSGETPKNNSGSPGLPEFCRRIIFIEAALFTELKLAACCQEIWLVTAAVERRVARLEQSRGLKREQILARIAAQQSDAELLRLADAVIDNSGDFAVTKARIDGLLVNLYGKERFS